MSFDEGWSRKASDKVAFEQRPEHKEGGSWGALDVFKEVAEKSCGWSEVRGRREGREALGPHSCRRAGVEPEDGWEAVDPIQVGWWWQLRLGVVGGEMGSHQSLNIF